MLGLVVVTTDDDVYLTVSCRGSYRVIAIRIPVSAALTTGFPSFAVCQEHAAKPQKHTAKSLPCAVHDKASTATRFDSKNILPCVFYQTHSKYMLEPNQSPSNRIYLGIKKGWFFGRKHQHQCLSDFLSSCRLLAPLAGKFQVASCTFSLVAGTVRIPVGRLL